jgi:arylsulfatase A-like enzyme/Flp pilus assembly protein TadD
MKIKMKKRIPLLFFILIGIILTDDALLASETKQANFNVLLVTIDTIRPDRLSCYSTEYLKTPHIDSLAAKGVIFDRAFAHNPTTLPSHTNILLGTTPLYHGVQDNSKFRVSEDHLTLAEYLKSKGYSTAAFIGAFPLDSRFGLSQGFDVYDDSYPSKSNMAFAASERKAEQVIQSALDWLEKQDSKWFAWVHLWDPHTLYLPPEPFKSQFEDDPYSGEVAYVDFELGKMFDYLDNNDLMENTLIILTGDHGESLGEHGELTHTYFAYNSTLWIPMIIAGPGIDARRIDENVSHIDIFPSLCDILGIEKPSFLQGVSLLPLMTGGKIEKRAIYFESLGPHYNHGWAPLRGFIEENEKFIDSPLPEYYNLEEDFDEMKNLVDTISLDKYKEKQKNIEEKFFSPQNVQGRQRIDREALEKLRSLGYVDSPVSQPKNSYGEEDDLKTLLPLRQNLDKAIILHDAGEAEASIKLLNETIQQRKDFAEAYLYLYHIYKAQGQKEKVLEVLEEGMNNNPEHFAIISTYGIFLVKEKMWDKGIEVLQKSLAIVDFDPEVHNFLGLAYWRKGKVQMALEQFREALALDDSDAMVYSNLGALYHSVFLRAGKKADHSLSMEYFKKAIELDPNMIAAYKGLGAGYGSIGRIREAISVWLQALELSPKDNFLVLNLGIAHLGIGKKAQALKYFENYLLLNKDTITAEDRKRIEALIQECKKE